MKTHPLRCRCGALQGVLQVSRSATRALCYCADCQAYARHLGSVARHDTEAAARAHGAAIVNDGILDGAGGTEVVATHPRYLRFTMGTDALACLSLSPRGLLRWYAQCCRTPIGNTARNQRLAYVGLVHVCLGDEAARQASFGAVRMAVNTQSAHGTVPRFGPGSRAVALFNLAGSLLGARLSSSYRQTPFFDAASHAPVRTPYVLSKAERERAYRDAAAPNH
ncbi:MAG: hypothetical protein J0H09_21200 [Burkholderiales bacterium]|nr:hypothetical protein [Burkholderiales bacterium]